MKRISTGTDDMFGNRHTIGHIDCPVCEGSRTMLLTRLSPTLPFREAAKLWLESRTIHDASGAVSARYVKPNTERSYRQYIGSLNLFFGDIPLNKIHIGHMSEYQQARVNGDPPFIRKIRPNKNVVPGPCPASGRKTNQELTLLRKLLIRAGCWSEDTQEFYQPLFVPYSNISPALTKEQRQHWLDVSSLRPEWAIVNWYSHVAFGTSMGAIEMRHLRLGDVNLNHGTVSVAGQGAKRKSRVRSIPITSAEVAWALEQLIERAKDLGATSPMHFIFPFRKNPFPFDPTRPMSQSGIRKQWNEVRKVAGLLQFSQNHTRHTALTHWAEDGVRLEEMRRLAGHLGDSNQTLHYARICEGHLRKTMEMVDQRRGPQSIGQDYRRIRRA